MQNFNELASPVVRFGVTLGAILLVAAGPVCGFFLTRIFLEAQSSANWPSVAGAITKAEVGATATGRYFPDVTYDYKIGESHYTGTRVRASDGEYNVRDGAAQAIDDLQAGMTVAVFYDPSHPARSVLKPGAGLPEYVLLLVPVVMFGFGLRVLWSLMRPHQLK